MTKEIFFQIVAETATGTESAQLVPGAVTAKDCLSKANDCNRDKLCCSVPVPIVSGDYNCYRGGKELKICLYKKDILTLANSS